MDPRDQRDIAELDKDNLTTVHEHLRLLHRTKGTEPKALEAKLVDRHAVRFFE